MKSNNGDQEAQLAITYHQSFQYWDWVTVISRQPRLLPRQVGLHKLTARPTADNTYTTH